MVVEQRQRNALHFGTIVTRRLRAMGIQDKPIAPASPWQNERLIGSIRRECVDHLVILSEALRIVQQDQDAPVADRDAAAYRSVQWLGNIA